MSTDFHLEERGIYGMKGRWVPLSLAREISVGGEAWWEIAELDGEKVQAIQHDPQGPADQPIFLYNNGDMYIGGWKVDDETGKPVENGLGISYNNSKEWKGQISICKEFKDGQLNGKAKVFWLENAPTWKRNWLPGSPIRRPLISQQALRGTSCVPFIYEGNFQHNQRCDNEAKVTLKSGECRQGPWADDTLAAFWKSHLYKLVQPPKFKLETGNENNEEHLVQVRGADGLTGIWLSLDEAKQYTVGQEEDQEVDQEAWWEIAELDGKKVEVKQYDPTGPSDKPIYLSEDGSMYLGPWAQSMDPHKKWPVESGFGVYYNKAPNEHDGIVSICNEISEGAFHGRGKTFWLESAPIWKKNSLPDSPVHETVLNNHVVERPFIYEGNFKDDMRHDPEAKVVLKDGTTATMAWEKDERVGYNSESVMKKAKNLPNHKKIFGFVAGMVKATGKKHADRESVSDMCKKMKVTSFNTAVGKLVKSGWIIATEKRLELTELGLQKSGLDPSGLIENESSDLQEIQEFPSREDETDTPLDSMLEKRGENGMEGEWLSLDEALEETEGNEPWWEIAELDGKKVEIKQYDPNGPVDKPFFRWKNGDMYLGPWAPNKDREKTWFVEEGFGVMYANYPDEHQGRIDICKEIRQGFLNGQAKSFWLESAPSWKKNILKGSQIGEKRGKRRIPRPFIYEGSYEGDLKACDNAKVTLKDGTCDTGPWRADMPVGRWFSHDKPSHQKQLKPEAKSKRPKAKSKIRVDERDSSVSKDNVGLIHKRKRKQTDRYTDKAKEASSSRAKKSSRSETKQRANDNTSKKRRAPDNPRRPQVSNNCVTPVAPTSAALITHRVPSAEDVIELLDSDESATEISDIDRVNSVSRELGKDTKEQLVRTFWRWLCSNEAIGSKVNPKQMEEYAKHFYDEGCDSYEALFSLYEIAPDYIDGLEWMKPVHRILLKHNLEKLTNQG